jgi:chemotaxis protein methyltransferase CheR
MDKSVFDIFREIIYKKSGISLSEKKEALVGARVSKRLRALGIGSFEDYLRYLNDDQSGEEMVQLLDAISTNVTHFFREPEHFDLLSRLLRQGIEAGHRRFRFWSAGCSSGEEPYSLAMTICETCNAADYDMKILATDISTKILRRCINGIYEEKKMDSVPALLQDRYFEREEGSRRLYAVRQELKRMIMFKRLNLSAVPFPMKGPMDAIFCRNVMIYFDNDVRKKLLNEFYRLLKPEGYLFVGHAESLTGMLSGLKAARPSVYKKQSIA